MKYLDLFKKVLDLPNLYDVEFQDNVAIPVDRYDFTRLDPINVFELASMCKEFVAKYNYFIEVRFIQECKQYRAVVHYDDGKMEDMKNWMLADTETDAVFEACDWAAKFCESK